jgi:flagellar protein FliL
MADKEDEKEGAKGKGGKGKIIIMVVPLVLLLAAAGWYFFLRGGGSGAPKALPPPAAGTVVVLDPITINLAGGHFLKLGLTLQPTKAAKDVTGDKALDLAITEYSGKTVGELSSSAGRETAKDELVARIKLAYVPDGNDAALEAAIAKATGKATGKATPTSSPSGQAPNVEDQLRGLTDKQAVAAAAALTVQTDVYDVYLTTFVMQ